MTEPDALELLHQLDALEQAVHLMEHQITVIRARLERVSETDGASHQLPLPIQSQHEINRQ